MANGHWTPWLTATTQTQATFAGELGVAYAFRVRATDNVNNASDWVQAEAKTVVVKKYYSADQRVAMRENGVLYYLHTDHLGSASLTTDASGTIHAQQRYFPYGETRWSSAPLPTDRQFTGQRREAALGIYDYKARFYSPRLGRFLNADTVVPGVGSQHLNRYMYVEGNPVRYNDPTGHARPTEESENYGKTPLLPAQQTSSLGELKFELDSQGRIILWVGTITLYEGVGKLELWQRRIIQYEEGSVWTTKTYIALENGKLTIGSERLELVEESVYLVKAVWNQDLLFYTTTGDSPQHINLGWNISSQPGIWPGSTIRPNGSTGDWPYKEWKAW